VISGEDNRILSEFSRRIRERFQEARIWAFGSRVRGNATWDSDFDICVVLECVNKETYDWIRDIAWEIGFENERVITTVLFDAEEFEKGPMSGSTIVGTILKEGVPA